jgi:hypothetical protein
MISRKRLYTIRTMTGEGVADTTRPSAACVHDFEHPVQVRGRLLDVVVLVLAGAAD